MIERMLDDPKGTFEILLNNKEFRRFVKENENKSIEEIAQIHNIDFILTGMKNVQKF